MKVLYIPSPNIQQYHIVFEQILRKVGDVDITHDIKEVKNPHNYDVIFVEGTDIRAIDASLLEHKHLIIRTTGVEIYQSKLHNINWPGVKWLLAYSSHQIEYFQERWRDGRRCYPKNYGTLPPVALLDEFPLKRENNPYAVAMIANITGRKGVQTIPEFLKAYPKYHVHHLGKVCMYGDPIHDFVGWTTEKDGTRKRWHYDKIIKFNQISGYLNTKNYIWLASIQEGFNRSLLEGMCKGLSPIVRRFPGADELWPEKYIYDSISDIEVMLENPMKPEEARQWVVDRYSPSKIAGRLEEYL